MKKKVKKNEIETFIKFCKPYLDMYPSLIRPFEAVISEAQNIIFGNNKSNEQKFKEVLKMIDISFKASAGTMEIINAILNRENKSSTKVALK